MPDHQTVTSTDRVEIDYVGLREGRRIDYVAGWDLQREVHAKVAAGELAGRVLLLEHDPVYTAGRQTLPEERPFDGTPVVDVDRGGKITWHGPGQLVGYPILTIPRGVGVVDHVRRMEQAVIDLLAEMGLATHRVAGRTGVWLPRTVERPERKICAIGIRVARRTTMHGFAININNTTTAFENIVPCGIRDAGVTTVSAELGSVAPLIKIADLLVPHLQNCLDYSRPRSQIIRP